MTTSNDTKHRAATTDELNAALVLAASSTAAALWKYELARTTPSAVTSLGWSIIALDLRRWCSSPLSSARILECERKSHGVATREQLEVIR